MNGGNLDIPDQGGFVRSPAKVVADPAWRRREKPRFRWAFWLGGLALISLAGAAAMIALDREPATPAEAPLITADPTPVRVRPDDPGGLRVPNLDKSVYDQLTPGAARGGDSRPGLASGTQVESLLPPPEAPRPVPPPPSPAVRPAALAEGPSPSQLAREPETPAPAQQAAIPPAPQSPAPAAAAPAAAPAAPGGTGRIQVQLAAVPTEQAAAAEWERLRRRMPDLLGNQRLAVSRGEREGQPFWRVRTGAFETNAAARAFCEQVRARGGSCFVAPSG